VWVSTGTEYSFLFFFLKSCEMACLIVISYRNCTDKSRMKKFRPSLTRPASSEQDNNVYEQNESLDEAQQRGSRINPL
jgi:hypothetical protein